MVTVRELARSQGFPDSFVFEAIGQNVVTVSVLSHEVQFPLTI
jgi:DNA (cytosine-5)-methyltransferase 1